MENDGFDSGLIPESFEEISDMTIKIDEQDPKTSF